MTSILQALSCANDYDPNSLSVTRARELILSLITPVAGRQRVFIRQALDRVLAEDVISPIDVPSHDNSAMDGYALRFTDLTADSPTRLKIMGTAFAGRALTQKVGAGDGVASGQTARIMTGAILPKGVDTVVVQEVTRVDGDFVEIPATQPNGLRLGQHIRRAGEDLSAGKPALRAGKKLRPAELGILASLGVAEVSVHRRLRVALFSTGDELCSIGTPLTAGEVYDSNRYTLWGMLERMGCEVLDMGVVRDDPAALEAALREAAASADVIITSGGVSVGEADFIKTLMTQLGEVAFWKIAMKPGRPMAFGRIFNNVASKDHPRDDHSHGAYLFGLPGNPVAVMVTFYQFVRPALLALAGVTPNDEFPAFPARCTESIRKGRGRTEFLRGVLTRECNPVSGALEWSVRPVGAQGSGVLRSMSEANCFIVLPPEQSDIETGATVLVQPMHGLV
jgi:molybdopterin molybdotransferase